MARYLLQRQGEAWIAAAPGLLDPSESPVGHGQSAEEAIDDLARQPEIQAWLRENNLADLRREDFDVREGALDLRFFDATGRRHRHNPATDNGL